MNKLQANERLENGRLTFISESVVKPVLEENGIKRVRESAAKKLVLKPKIAAIHEGRTRNDTIYTEEKLRGSMSGPKGPTGMYSFLYPYRKPMIKNHDTDTEPVGRVANVQYVKTAQNKGYIMIVPHITDQETIEKILDGRYLTVSIGASTDSAICNICGRDIINEGWCEHERGETYDGNVCGYILGDLIFNECSWVNVPADMEAQIIDPGEAEVYATTQDEDNTAEETIDLSSGALVQESAASELGLDGAPDLPAEEASQEEATEEDQEQTTEQTEGADQSAEDTTPDTTEQNEEADGREDSRNALEDDQQEAQSEEQDGELDGLRQANAEAQATIASQAEQIASLEQQVAQLTQSLAEREQSRDTVVSEFSAFLNQLILDESATYELSTEDLALEDLDLDGLRVSYQKIKSQSELKYRDLAKYKVPNPAFGNTEKVTEAEEEPKGPTQPATAVEIFSTLLRSNKSKK